MPTPEYTLIRGVIQNQPTNAIEARYVKDPAGSTRKLWPYVLGTTPSAVSNAPDVEMVLCYQYDGYTPRPLATPHQSRSNFRCFKVASLKNPQPIPFVPVNPPPPTGQAWQPKKLKPKQLKKQNCVEDVDVSR